MKLLPTWKNGRMALVNEKGQVLNKTNNKPNSLQLLDEASAVQRASFYAYIDLTEEYLRLRKKVAVLEKMLAGRTRSLAMAGKAHRARLQELRALQATLEHAKVSKTKAPKAPKAPTVVLKDTTSKPKAKSSKTAKAKSKSKAQATKKVALRAK